MSRSGKQINTCNTVYMYSKAILPYGVPIHTHTKDYEFSSMCDCPVKDIKFYKVVIYAKLLQ